MGATDEAAWQYAPAFEYKAPQPASTEKVSSNFHALWKEFWKSNRKPSIVEDHAEFAPLSDADLAEVLPAADWSEASAGLANTLDSWLDDPGRRSSCRAVVGPPGCGIGEVVARWGERHSARRLDPPPRHRLLEAGADWSEAMGPEHDGLLVIPEFERFYLRHHNGLDLMRRLIERLWVSPRRVVVGCESWAWAYLLKTVQIDSVFRMAIALSPLDEDALRTWFRPRPRGRYLVQTARGGEVLYPCLLGNEAGGSSREAASGETPQTAGSQVFQRIAETSRGIPGVALALWRHGLCQGEVEPVTLPEGLPLSDQPKAIRVRSPQELTLPELPARSTTREAVVLHTLLLHSGLSVPILCQLVPFPMAVVVGTLSALRDAGLIADESGCWRVTRLGYPSVRRYLLAEGLLVDAF